MAEGPTWIALAGVALGGGIGLVTTLAVDLARERRDRRTRWDPALQAAAAEFVVTTRKMLHVAGRLDRWPDREDARRQLEGHHAELRGLYAVIGLLGSLECQRTARLVVRYAYRLRDGYEASPEHAEAHATAYDRVIDAIADFQRAARVDLRVRDAEHLLDENDFREGTVATVA